MPDINWKEKFELLKKLNASPPAPASPEPVESVSVPPEPEIPAITAEADKIIFLSPDNLDKFPNDPFHEYEGETLEQFTASIREHGILTPIIVRPKENGKFEILSGRNRNNAAKLLNLESVPCIVRNVDDDEAVLIVAESNLSQRENQLPSEKAFAYKMKLDALNRKAGRPSKENYCQVGNNFEGKTSNDIIAEQSADSSRQIARYIRLTELTPLILEMIDEKQIAFNPAVELSYLAEKEQQELYDTMQSEDCTPSLAQAQRMKKLSRAEGLTPEIIAAMMSEAKANQRETLKLPLERVRQFAPKANQKQLEDFVLKACEHYRKHLNRQQERGR